MSAAPQLDRLAVHARLMAACWELGGQKFFAEKHGISPAYVSDVLNARRDPGDAILTALGLRKVIHYVELRCAK